MWVWVWMCVCISVYMPDVPESRASFMLGKCSCAEL